MYALMANTGQPHGAAPPPPVLLPAALGAGKALGGKTVGVCWQVGRTGDAGDGAAGWSCEQQGPTHLKKAIRSVHTYGMLACADVLPATSQGIAHDPLTSCRLLLQWFDAAEPAVRDACNAALALLQARGKLCSAVAVVLGVSRPPPPHAGLSSQQQQQQQPASRAALRMLAVSLRLTCPAVAAAGQWGGNRIGALA